MDEFVDILDDSGRFTGSVRLKSEAHRDGLWHRCFHCWVVYLPDSGEPELLLQRRATVKDTWPGRLDVSVGGHLSAGEDILDGVREMREELGLEASAKDLIPLGEQRVEREIPQGLDREFHGVFLYATKTPPEELTLQPEEVDSVVLITLKDAERFSRGLEVGGRELPGGGGSHAVRISPSETVHGSEEYFRWVVGRVRESVDGP